MKTITFIISFISSAFSCKKWIKSLSETAHIDRAFDASFKFGAGGDSLFEMNLTC